MSNVTWSARGYRGTEGLYNSPLVSISRERKEELVGFSLRSAVWLIGQHIPPIPPLSKPSPTSPTSKISSSTAPLPPPKVAMASAVKLLVFRGVGNEEPGQF